MSPVGALFFRLRLVNQLRQGSCLLRGHTEQPRATPHDNVLEKSQKTLNKLVTKGLEIKNDQQN